MWIQADGRTLSVHRSFVLCIASDLKGDSPENHDPDLPPALTPRGSVNHVGNVGPERQKLKSSCQLPAVLFCGR